MLSAYKLKGATEGSTQTDVAKDVLKVVHKLLIKQHIFGDAHQRGACRLLLSAQMHVCKLGFAEVKDDSSYPITVSIGIICYFRGNKVQR